MLYLIVDNRVISFLNKILQDRRGTCTPEKLNPLKENVLLKSVLDSWKIVDENLLRLLNLTDDNTKQTPMQARSEHLRGLSHSSLIQGKQRILKKNRVKAQPHKLSARRKDTKSDIPKVNFNEVKILCREVEINISFRLHRIIYKK